MRNRSFHLCAFWIVLAVAAHAVHADEYRVVSPNGRNILTVTRTDTGVHYAVRRDGKEIIRPTPIAITIDGKALPGDAAVADVQSQTLDETVTPVVPTIGSALREHCRESRVAFACGVALRLRAYDDGVAFRWESSLGQKAIVVDGEALAFGFRKDFAVYFPKPNGEGFFSHQENEFDRRPVTKCAGLPAGPVPALLELGGGDYLLITDVNVEGYPGLWLRGGEKTTLVAEFPRYPAQTQRDTDRDVKIVERKPHLAETVGERTYPWRAFVLADAAGLLTSTMLYHLAEPSRLAETSWIRPGKVAWDWWNALNIHGVPFRAGVNQDTYKHYIDFAAENGIPYIILDEGWSVPGPENLLKVVPEIDMPALIRYGVERRVGVVLWMTSTALEANFQRAFEQFEAWGVAGLKIDFMQRDDQIMMDFLYRAAAEAARRKMIVDYHGGPKPAGITRTWPNVLTIESVLGLEQAKWCDKADPEMAVLLPFIRMVVGPMDYTPGAMVNLQKKDFRSMFSRPASMGTRAHQLAMYVVYVSPLQMLADSPSHYRANPDCLPFLRRVPVTWDETRVLAAEVGKVVAVARRHGDTWYVGALTDWTARDLSLPLDFLAAGPYAVTAWSDGVNADRYGSDVSVTRREVDAKGKLGIHLAPGGGFAAIVEKAPTP